MLRIIILASESGEELFGDNFGELKDETENKGGAPVIVTPRKPYAR